MNKYKIAQHYLLLRSRLLNRISGFDFQIKRRVRSISVFNLTYYFKKHASVSFLAALLVGSGIIDTSYSKDANLATLFPPPPDVTTNIINGVKQYINIDNTDSSLVSLKLADLDSHDIIQNQPLLMIADDASPLGGAGIVYTVQKGDSYGKVAAYYGLNVSSILAANNIDTAKIKKDTKALDLHEGQQINIPFENIDGPGWNDVLGAIQSAKDAAAAKVAKSNPKTKPPKGKSVFLGSSSGRDYGTYSSFTAGWCTAYAAKVRPDVGDAVRSQGGGNAARWGSAAKAAGYRVDLKPEVGAIGGSAESRFGHLFRIDSVNGDSITISEYNGPAGRGVLGRREISTSMLKFVIH